MEALAALVQECVLREGGKGGKRKEKKKKGGEAVEEVVKEAVVVVAVPEKVRDAVASGEDYCSVGYGSWKDGYGTDGVLVQDPRLVAIEAVVYAAAGVRAFDAQRKKSWKKVRFIDIFPSFPEFC